MSEYPRMFRIRQKFERPVVVDIAAEVDAQLRRLDLGQRIRPGQSVAITAGSRGIAAIPVILRSVVEHLKRLEAKPFLVPAMGSHGGGTAEAQKSLLHGLGITESSCGCPILASMETVEVCRAKEGFPVYFDRLAFEADHVVVCGRVKPHTDFAGDVESGLLKMLLIGLGKHDGAKIYHRAFKDYSFSQIVHSVAAEVLARCRIAAGLAILENAYDQTALIEALRPEDFRTREPELLKQARAWLPRLPFAEGDLLVIDEIGKEISGTGLDTNVIGRKFGLHAAGPDESPRIRYIAVRGLTSKTKGNATGLGMVEFCRTRVVRQRDVRITRVNCLTGGNVEFAMTPVDYETDAAILDTVFPLLGLVEPPNARVMWIQNTLQITELACSAAYLEQAHEREDLEILEDLQEMPFDAEGNLPETVMQWQSAAEEPDERSLV